MSAPSAKGNAGSEPRIRSQRGDGQYGLHDFDPEQDGPEQVERSVLSLPFFVVGRDQERVATAIDRWRKLAIGVTLVAAGLAVTVVGLPLLQKPSTPNRQLPEQTIATSQPPPISASVAPPTPAQPPVERPVAAERPAPVAVPRRLQNKPRDARPVARPPAAPRTPTFVPAAAPPVATPRPPGRAAPPPPVAAPAVAVASPAATVAAPAVVATPPALALPPPASASPVAVEAAAANPSLAPGPPPRVSTPAVVTDTGRAATEAVVVAPGPSSRDVERSAIENVLGRYQSAFNNLDAAAASTVWPAVNEKGLAKAFERIEEQRVSLDDCRIDVGGVAAEAACTGTTRYVPKVGSRSPRAESMRWRFNLRKASAGWVIDRVETR